jgi:hypothetical protein
MIRVSAATSVRITKARMVKVTGGGGSRGSPESGSGRDNASTMPEVMNSDDTATNIAEKNEATSTRKALRKVQPAAPAEAEPAGLGTSTPA